MTNRTTRRRRTIAGVLAGVMMLSVAPILGLNSAFAADTAPPVAEPIGAGNVCEGAPNEEPFSDVTTSDPSYDEIVCLFQADITKGKTATTFAPAGTLTRREMALFIKRLVDTANANETQTPGLKELPAYDGQDDYPDVGKESQAVRVAIDQLSQTEIAKGFTDGTYKPNATLKRRQMAKFIVRAYEFMTGETLPVNGDYFDDDEGDSAETEFNKLAEQGIFIGNGQGTVNPGGDLSRRQMASILLRTLQVLFEDGDITGLFADGDFTPANASVRPELISAAITETTSSGTKVRYTFDEEITGANAPVANLFHVFTQTGAQSNGSGTPAIDAGGKSVVVNFSGITSESGAEALTVATVDFGAVEDDEAAKNPIGDAPLGTSSSNTAEFPPGKTDAPDLSTVQGFGPGTNATLTKADFIFDEPAFIVDDAGFFLVTRLGELVECTATAGGGTITITAQCENTTATGQIDASEVARGYVNSGAVSDAEQPPTAPISGPAGNVNPLQATETPDESSSKPDLVSAALQFNTDQAADTEDAVIFTFNQPVELTATASQFPPASAAEVAGGQFTVYDTTGAEMTGTSAARGTTASQVVVTFADGDIDEAVGASVATGAVRSTTGDTTRTNEADEEPVNNNRTSTTTRTAGRTNNPDLLGVAIANDSTGNPVVTYTFDEDLNLVNNGNGLFFLLLADGTRLVCNNGEATNPSEEAADATVTCDTFSVATTAGAPSSDLASDDQIRRAVAGSVDDDAVIGEDDTLEQGFGTPFVDNTAFGNPEGAELTTGGTGTAQQ